MNQRSFAAHEAAWRDALHAAQVLAIDPVGLGGVRLRARPGPLRDAWLAALRTALASGQPWLRLPAQIDDDSLLGGLDLSATLQSAHTVSRRGLLARCDQGVLVVPMAERLAAALGARLCAALDRQWVEGRCGSEGDRARFGIVALDESLPGDEGDDAPPAGLCERLALHIDLDDAVAPGAPSVAMDAVVAARARWRQLRCGDDALHALGKAADRLGITSVRAVLHAVRVARAVAALAGRDRVAPDDLATAGRWVLAARATRAPASEARAERQPEAGPDPSPASDGDARDAGPSNDDAAADPTGLAEHIVQASCTTLSAGLLSRLQGSTGTGHARREGRHGAARAGTLRGRPVGSRRGDPRGGARLHLIDTLRAAAPWQSVRARERPSAPLRVQLRREDFRVHKRRQRRETTTLFVVDASGSAALHRLSEAKAAVELLLADCYVRRDRVALLAFRGTDAELLLPPTRSLARARRCLAALPGGGGTPLAAAFDAARRVVDDVLRRGGTPLSVWLSDGRANIARDGSPGRAQAHADALRHARAWRECDVAALWIDTSPKPQADAQAIATAMGARYLPLPLADGERMSRAVRSCTAVHRAVRP